MKFIIKTKKSFMMESDVIEANNEQEAVDIYNNKEKYKLSEYKIDKSDKLDELEIKQVGCDEKLIFHASEDLFPREHIPELPDRTIGFVVNMVGAFLQKQGLKDKYIELFERFHGAGPPRSIDDIFLLLEDYVKIVPDDLKAAWINYYDKKYKKT